MAADPKSPAPPRYTFRHLPQLDGYRGLAILLVLVGHAGGRVNLNDGLAQLSQMGVLLFFGLSGFLVTGLLYQEAARAGTISIRQFYLNRGLRILPACWFYLFVVGGLAVVQVVDIRWHSLVAAFIGLRNIFGRPDVLAHIWSLSLEQQFYTFWPWLARQGWRDRLLEWTVGGIVLVTLWRTLAIVYGVYVYQEGTFYYRTDFRMDSILVGAAIVLLLHRVGPERVRLHPLVRWLDPVWLLPVLAGWTMTASNLKWANPIYLTVQTILAAALLLCLVRANEGFWVRQFSAGWLQWFGRMSYSIYLWQHLFLTPLASSWGGLRDFPWNILASVGAGVASHHLVEKPFLKWKDRLRRDRDQKSAAPGGTLPHA